MKFFAENLKVFKFALPLFLLVVLSNNIDQYLNIKVESALQDPTGETQGVYLYGFFSILSSVIFPVLLMTLALYAMSTLKSAQKFSSFFEKYLNQVFIETLRSWGKTLLWSLLLIVPGVWKFFEYTFVPFVVTSSEKYDQGQVDALKASSQVFRRHWFKVLAIICVFHIFIPLVLASFFDAYRLIWKTPIASLLLSLLDTYLLLVSTQLLFNVFQTEVGKNDAYV